jgi:nucleotide-binding universal stress UspA family protein
VGCGSYRDRLALGGQAGLVAGGEHVREACGIDAAQVERDTVGAVGVHARENRRGDLVARSELVGEPPARRVEHEYETELIGGPPAEAIANVARVRDADEIVVGARGLGRVRALLGSVSHELLHIADRPVLVIPAAAVESVEAGPSAW